MNRKIRDAMRESVERSVTGATSLRALVREDPIDFLLASVSLLNDEPDAPGKTQLLKTLAGSDDVIEEICDPAFMTEEQAAQLTALLAQVDPFLDTKLARLLQRVHAKSSVRDNRLQMDRILALLDAIPSSARILPVLTTLLSDPNPRLRAKLAKLVGQRVQNTRFAADRQSESDPRVRANAIESLWGDTKTKANSLLWNASKDEHNRVVGNALLGLYQVQDRDAFSAIEAMSTDQRPHFRASAAWVMGQTADPLFLPALEKLARDLYSLVRKNASKALQQIAQKHS